MNALATDLAEARTEMRRWFCGCGCGERTEMYTRTDRTRRVVKGQPRRFIFGHWGRKEPEYTVDPETGCWIWIRTINVPGYGVLERDGKTLSAHRFMYERLVGPIPEGLELDHLCRVKHCVNPEHLEPVTHAENMRRAAPYQRKTHCKRGHPFDAENTSINANTGERRCKACNRLAWHEKQRRRRQKASNPPRSEG